MDGTALRARRRALGYTQSEFAAMLNLSADYVGKLENGRAPITPSLARAITTVRPRHDRGVATTSDPMERLIEEALIDAGIRYVTDQGGGTTHRLDFHLPDFDVAIEVKRLHTPRISNQMARAANVIVAQGDRAVLFLAAAIRSGDFFELLSQSQQVRDHEGNMRRFIVLMDLTENEARRVAPAVDAVLDLGLAKALDMATDHFGFDKPLHVSLRSDASADLGGPDMPSIHIRP